jgi:predicted permease
MQIILKQLFILYIFLIVGWVIGKLKKDKAEHSDILSVLLVNFFLPCKVFGTFAKNVTVSYITEKYKLLLASLVLMAVVVAISFILPKLLTKNRYEQKVYTYSTVITNYGYLGYALIGAVFGELVLTDFMLFAIPFITFTYTAGYALLTGGDKPLKRLFNAITAAIVLGITVGLTGLNLPSVITETVSIASSCVGPVSMVLTGMVLSTFAIKELISSKSTYVFSFIRLVLIPGAVYLVCRVAHLDAYLPMMLIITCMPCGLNTIVFPKLIGEDCKLGARLALITHVFSLATLPFWLSLIK